MNPWNSLITYKQIRYFLTYLLYVILCMYIYFFECIGVSVKCLTSLMVAFLIALIRVSLYEYVFARFYTRLR